MDSPQLETAKERLKAALKRLEKTLERRLREADVKIAQATTAQPQKPAAPDKNQLAEFDGLKKQLKHLEEENATLKQELGGEREQTRQLKATQEEVAGRMDGVIGTIKTILQKEGV